jgi:hypothetical protein
MSVKGLFRTLCIALVLDVVLYGKSVRDTQFPLCETKYEHVGVGTRLRAGQSGVRILVGKRVFLLFKTFWPALGPTQPPTQLVPGFFPRGAKLTTHLDLVLRLRMSGAVPHLPLYAFMAWTGKNLPFLPLVVRATSKVVQIWAWWWDEMLANWTVTGLRASSAAVWRVTALICVGQLWFVGGQVKVNCRLWCPRYIHMHICMWLYVICLCTPWRCVWEWRCSSTHYYTGTSWRWVVGFTLRPCYPGVNPTVCIWRLCGSLWRRKNAVPLPGIEQRYLRYPNYWNNFWICVLSEQEHYLSLCCSVQGSEGGSVMPADSQPATLSACHCSDGICLRGACGLQVFGGVRPPVPLFWSPSEPCRFSLPVYSSYTVVSMFGILTFRYHPFNSKFSTSRDWFRRIGMRPHVSPTQMVLHVSHTALSSSVWQ